MLSRLRRAIGRSRLLPRVRGRRPGDGTAGTTHAAEAARGLDRQLEKARAAWLERMQAFTDGFGCVELPFAPMLTEKHHTYWSPLECMRYGVVQAVNELCLAEDWEVVYFSLAHCMYCDVALRRRRG